MGCTRGAPARIKEDTTGSVLGPRYASGLRSLMYSHGRFVSDASFSWTHTEMPNSTLARSAKPMWSK
jgi:hypothetical protein